jgi:formylglycine-generating enzyme required for sulfatase activity
MRIFPAIALALICGAAAPLMDSGMVRLPAGSYVPFYARESARQQATQTQRMVAVDAFRLDRFPVTNAQFLTFVAAHPEWRKSQVRPIFADAHYLARWPADLALREGDAARPVTHASWFAAQAYCEAQDKSLPSTDQWEYALADHDRTRVPLRQQILAWYGRPNSQELPNVQSASANGYGIRGLVGLVWEWTIDFNSMMAGQDLRSSGARFCGGSSIGAADASDYASFMRYAMRASLKAAYTTGNLGFRCASNTP